MNRSAKSVKRFERSNRLDTALYKNIPLPSRRHGPVRFSVLSVQFATGFTLFVHGFSFRLDVVSICFKYLI